MSRTGHGRPTRGWIYCICKNNKKNINLKIYHVEQLAVDYFFLSMNSGISRVQVYLKVLFYIFDLFLSVQSLRLSIVMSNVIRDTLYVLLVINPQRLSWMVKFIRWIFITWESYLSRYFRKYCILNKLVPFCINHDFTMKMLTKLNKWNEMPLSLFCIKWRVEKLLFAVVTYYGYRGYIPRETSWNTFDSKLNHTRDFYQTLFMKCFVKIELANFSWIIH